MSVNDELIAALTTCQGPKAKQLVQQQLDAGTPALELLGVCNRGMTELGERFARGECFVPELMIGGKIMKEISALLKPLLMNAAPPKPIGTVVLGSVKGDLHHIGKDIVTMMLSGAGFAVIDLGVNVPPEKFVEAVRQHKPQFVGMSVLLTTCWGAVSSTVNALKDAGLADDTAVMVGGAAASQRLADESGCNYYGKSAVDGLNYAREKVTAA